MRLQVPWLTRLLNKLPILERLRMKKPKIRNRVAVIVIQDEKILLVQHEKNGRKYWLLPGGGVEYGETLMDAARRELVEETGFFSEIGDLLFVSESIPRDAHRHVINYYFEAWITGGTMIVGNDKQLCDVRWQPIGDLSGLVLFPNIKAELMNWIQNKMIPRRCIGNRWE